MNEKGKKMLNKLVNGNNHNYIALHGWQRFIGNDIFSFGYICSYKEAADTLVEQKTPDLNIYPIMFCYRQYLEQVLKNICYKKMNDEDYKNFVKKVSNLIGALMKRI